MSQNFINVYGLGKKKDSQIDRKLNQRQKKYWKSYRVSQTMYVQLRQEKRKIDDNVKGRQKKYLYLYLG